MIWEVYKKSHGRYYSKKSPNVPNYEHIALFIRKDLIILSFSSWK
jgi:hypothetical protein